MRPIIRVEEVSRIEKAVSLKIVNGAVKLIGSGLQPKINDCAGLPSVLCVGMFLCIELLNRVNRQNRSRCSLYAFRVDYCSSIVRIVVVRTVYNEIVVLRTITV